MQENAIHGEKMARLCYAECCFAFDILRGTRMCHTHLRPVPLYNICYKRQDLKKKKKVIEHKMCVLISPATFVRNTAVSVHTSTKWTSRPRQAAAVLKKAVQTAHHLMIGCSLFSSERPTVLQTLPPPLVLKYHINTVGVTSFLTNIFHTLQEQLKGNQNP